MKSNKKKSISTIIKIILSVMLIVLIFGSSLSVSKQDKINYTQFLECVDKGIVESVTINTSSGKVQYKLKDSDELYITSYPYTDDFIEKLLLKNIDVEIAKENTFLVIFRYIGSPLIMVLMLAGLFFITSGKANKDDEMVKSTTTFADVAGMEEVKEDLLLVSKMMNDEALKQSGARIPKGILLEGPPGNGKTLLARAFAGETGVNFIALNACDTGSPFVGIGSMKIKSIFDKAKKKAPCVIFIDELDAIGSKRSEHDDSASKEMNSILTSLLNQMDGFTPTDDIMVIAATNRSDSLDPALVRPGRFDRKFVVGLPDKQTREALFKLYTEKTNCNFNIDISKLATRTYGCSSSEIECIVNEAVINSIKHKTEENEIVVNNDDFNDAILALEVKGHVKKNYKRDEKDNSVVAFHEAGHAVSTYFKTGKKVSTITIAPTTSGAGGFTVSEFDDDVCLRPISEYYNEIITLYAGRAAEYILGGKELTNVSAGASNDIQRATRLSVDYVELKKGIDHSAFGKYGVQSLIPESEKLLDECWNESLKIVEEKWDYVTAVAQELIKNEKLESEDFEKIIKKVDAKHEKIQKIKK